MVSNWAFQQEVRGISPASPPKFQYSPSRVLSRPISGTFSFSSFYSFDQYRLPQILRSNDRDRSLMGLVSIISTWSTYAFCRLVLKFGILSTQMSMFCELTRRRFWISMMWVSPRQALVFEIKIYRTRAAPQNDATDVQEWRHSNKRLNAWLAWSIFDVRLQCNVHLNRYTLGQFLDSPLGTETWQKSGACSKIGRGLKRWARGSFWTWTGVLRGLVFRYAYILSGLSKRTLLVSL